jgi:tetratricopeptide (TPR) repeat protein
MSPVGRRIAALALSGLLCSGPAGVSEGQEPSPDPAEAGLTALDAGDLDAALAMLERAVAQQPDDAFLHYALGVTAAGLGRDVAAAGALARAATLDPALPGVHAELGLALYRLGERDRAEDHLLEALVQGPEDGDVLLTLGLIDRERGEIDRAIRLFEDAATVDPSLAAAAYYEAAGAALERDDLEGAGAYLERASSATGPEPARREAAELLALLRPEPPRRISLTAGAGVEYDDNLTVSAADLATGIDDVAAVLDAGIDVYAIRRPDVQLVIGYGLYQSLYRQATELDLQSHSPYLSLSAGDGRLVGTASYRYTNDSLGGDGFLSTHRGTIESELAVLPWMLVGGDLRLERLTFDEFTARDAQRISLGLGIRFEDAAGPVSVSTMWRPVWVDARGPQFDYRGDLLLTRLEFVLRVLGWPLDFRFSHEWEKRDYDNQTRSIGARRADDRHVFTGGLIVPLVGPTEASLDYVHVSSDSNLPELVYDENIVTFRLVAWY